MARRLLLPSPALRPLVQAYYLLDDDRPQAEQYVFLPEQLAHLTFSSSRTWSLGAGGLLTPVPHAALEGLVTVPAHLYLEGPLRTLRAELYPWAARQLFGWSYPDAPLDLLAGAAGRQAAGAAQAISAALRARDDETALGLLEDWLLALATGHQRAGQAGRGWTAGVGVQAAVQLYHSGGLGRMADLADELEVSARTLERQFMEDVGIGAKMLARLIRFETAHNALTHDPQTPLAALAFDLGFFDQAHLTREFRTLGGVTPGRFTQQIRARHSASEWLDFQQENPRVLLPQLPL
ncbi:helix-turn-helix domain-containing protein (plasmid) [Deinococcus sp. KNUC1210]|uniref:AraC family transcriptional regulator n=1 Tax=Deinococcus sp. KNUC1210 TaxID=2917691 RepID=UPI001EF0DE6E|nr:helix-turn-helix domain-containing protein [Deinococcus sp. KNUC1210]ULH17480.1 helix-turn-helix domain-containing protein [Deinococcus sp. KNUC1210]